MWFCSTQKKDGGRHPVYRHLASYSSNLNLAPHLGQVMWVLQYSKTSSSEANNCQFGTPRASAIFPSVSIEGIVLLFIRLLTVAFDIPIFSAKATDVIPFSINNSFIRCFVSDSFGFFMFRVGLYFSI